MSDGLKITSGMLFQGALFFALLDVVFVPLLASRVSPDAFRRLGWAVALVAGAAWYGIWSWAIGNFWESVYGYLFPAWGRIWIPILAGVIAAGVGAGLWALAMRFPKGPVLIFCLSGGLLGVASHIWAVYRGVVTKPPMLSGASPVGAVTLAFFEFMFYWSSILLVAALIERARAGLRRSRIDSAAAQFPKYQEDR